MTEEEDAFFMPLLLWATEDEEPLFALLLRMTEDDEPFFVLLLDFDELEDFAEELVPSAGSGTFPEELDSPTFLSLRELEEFEAISAFTHLPS
jgi:hypothetical protein